MFRKLIFFVLISACVFAATVFFRLGGHKSVHIERRMADELTVVYQAHLGPYHRINDVIVAVEQWTQSMNLPCPKTFGEFLDDPRLVEERRLRSNAGCVVPVKPEKLTQSEEPGAMQAKTFPARDAVVATFKGAPSIGPLKVYPAVEDWLEENDLKISGPVIEVYTIDGPDQATTEYIFPIE